MAISVAPHRNLLDQIPQNLGCLGARLGLAQRTMQIGASEAASAPLSHMTYSNPAAYQRFMGRWSSRLAPPFIRFAGIGDGQRVLDVGCGTGSLSAALLSVAPAVRVVGVDPVPSYARDAGAHSLRQWS